MQELIWGVEPVHTHTHTHRLLSDFVIIKFLVTVLSLPTTAQTLCIMIRELQPTDTEQSQS